MEKKLARGFAIADRLRELAARRLDDDGDVIEAGAAVADMAARLTLLSTAFDGAAEQRGIIRSDTLPDKPAGQDEDRAG